MQDHRALTAPGDHAGLKFPSSHPPSREVSQEPSRDHRSGKLLPSDTPQSAGPLLGVASDIPKPGRMRPTFSHAKGGMGFAHADSSPASPPAWHSDIEAASALASIGKGAGSFAPHTADIAMRPRLVPSPHDSMDDLRIVGSSLKRRRTEGPPSSSRAVDWQPSLAPHTSAPATMQPLPGPGFLKATDIGSSPVKPSVPEPNDPGLDLLVDTDAKDASPLEPESENIFRPAAQRGKPGNPAEGPRADPSHSQHRLGHCASSSFRFWAAPTPEQQEQQDPSRTLPADSSQPANIGPQPPPSATHRSGMNQLTPIDEDLPDPTLSAGEPPPYIPSPGLPKSAEELAEGLDKPATLAADVNDSDASETSHSDPGPEQGLWAQGAPSVHASGPQSIPPQPPAEQQLAGPAHQQSGQGPARPDPSCSHPSAAADAPAAVPNQQGSMPQVSKQAEQGIAGPAPAADTPAQTPPEDISEADQKLLARALDDSDNSTAGQLSRLEAILGCLRNQHLRHPSFKGFPLPDPALALTSEPIASFLQQAGKLPLSASAHEMAPVSSTADRTENPQHTSSMEHLGVARGAPTPHASAAQLHTPALSKPAAAASDQHERQDISRPSRHSGIADAAGPADRHGAANLQSKQKGAAKEERAPDAGKSGAGVDGAANLHVNLQGPQADGHAATLESAAAARPRGEGVTPADVSPNETSLLAYFAAAAQQEGAEVGTMACHCNPPCLVFLPCHVIYTWSKLAQAAAMLPGC